MQGALCGRLLLVVASTCVAAWEPSRPSPSDHGLRDSHDLPVPPIRESPNKSLDPQRQDLNTTLLLARLGRHFDPGFMSVARPQAPASRGVDFPFRRNARGRLIPVGEMPPHLRDVDTKFVRLPDGTKLRTRISARLRKKLQQFLWAYTACPVVYRWKDLGVRFWPRHLKEGTCPAGKASCSIPPGLQCRPATVEHKTVLRWHCHSGKSAMLSSRCSWLRVEYPVVSECACSCPHK